MNSMQNLKYQRGVAIPIIALMLLVMVALTGLALDAGNVFVHNTKLQNGIDAAAISAAVTVMKTNDTNQATIDGIATFDSFKNEAANSAIQGVTLVAANFEYSRDLIPFFPNNEPPFVRVTPALHSVNNFFIRVLGFLTTDILATAVAGPIGQNCNLVPLVFCATMSDDPTDPLPEDSECDTNDDDGFNDGDGKGECFGFNLKEVKQVVRACFKTGSAGGGANACDETDDLDAGNFGLLDLGELQGGRDIREALAGTVNVCDVDPLNTKPGYTWGNVKKGVNDRVNADKVTEEYDHVDLLVEGATPGVDLYDQRYIDAPTPEFDNPTGETNKRLMAVPFGDCRGRQNGNSDMPLVGIGCAFLTEKAFQDGSEKGVYVEVTDSCPGVGAISAENPVLNGPYKIVLFKDQRGTDS